MRYFLKGYKKLKLERNAFFQVLKSIENDRFQRFCEHRRIPCVRSKRNFPYPIIFSSPRNFSPPPLSASDP